MEYPVLVMKFDIRRDIKNLEEVNGRIRSDSDIN
jgi:hypothetical protein